MRIDMRPAALACANEACRNMSGVLDLDAMVRHFEKVVGLPTNPFVVGPATMERVFHAANLTDMSDMQAVLNAVEAALASAPAGDGVEDDYEDGRFREWSNISLSKQCLAQSREQLDPEFSEFMTAVAERLTYPSVGEPNRVALAQIIDPTAWQKDSDGYHVEQVHSDAALATADQVMRYLAALARPRATVGEWVPQIGERVEVTDDTPDAADWRALSLWVAGVRVHDSGDGLDVTVSEQWPIPSRVSRPYFGQTDDFRVGASSVADMLRPLRSPLGER